MIINLEIFKEYLFKGVWYIPIFRKPSHPGRKSINQHFLLPLLQPVPNLIRERGLQLNRDTVGERSHALGVQNSPPTRTVPYPVGERVFLPVYILSRTGMSGEGATPGGTLTTPFA